MFCVFVRVCVCLPEVLVGGSGAVHSVGRHAADHLLLLQLLLRLLLLRIGSYAAGGGCRVAGRLGGHFGLDTARNMRAGVFAQVILAIEAWFRCGTGE